MWYVYIIKSRESSFTYIGLTNDLRARFDKHNQGLVFSTKPYVPYSLEAYISVRTKKQAVNLEQYFKTGSGKVILQKRILQSSKL